MVKECQAKPSKFVTTRPDRPRAWRNRYLKDSGGVEEYVAKMVVCVSIRLQNHLRLERPLYAQTPIGITENGFKEAWRDDNCSISLKASGVYEAPGNAFWPNPACRLVWDGREIPDSGLSWANLVAGRSAWSEKKLARSSEVSRRRHYIVQGAFPTAIVSVGQSFQDLPCFSGRALLLGWWSTMDDMLRANNLPMILKLYNVALSMPIRMRVGPTFKQIVMDTITHSEEIFANGEAIEDSCFDFIDKSRHLIDLRDKPQRHLIQEFDNLKITFHGKAIKDQMVRCIHTVEPYAANGAIRDAARALGRVTKKFNDHTIVRKLCLACNKFYGKASQAAFDFCTKVLVTLRIALTYRDIRKERHLTGEFLNGKG